MLTGLLRGHCGLVHSLWIAISMAMRKKFCLTKRYLLFYRSALHDWVVQFQSGPSFFLSQLPSKGTCNEPFPLFGFREPLLETEAGLGTA
jgi:hypothetical protein